MMKVDPLGLEIEMCLVFPGYISKDVGKWNALEV